MRPILLGVSLLAGCTVLTSPGDYEGGDADGGASCRTGSDCPEGVCDTDRGRCVDCLVDPDCGDGRECSEGLCVAPTCGGAPCPDETPICLENETDEVCVECVAPTDCPPGEACSADFTCQACDPEVACAEDEACVPDDAGDFCVDCDGDGDGLIRRDPLCAGVAGERDCDDDGDGFCAQLPECVGECEELVADCDDSDATVRPVILGCGAGGFTTCSRPVDLLPGAGNGSMSVFSVGALPAPIDPSFRTPMFVLADDEANEMDVVYLDGERDRDAGTYADRVRRTYDLEARSFAEGPLPPTSLGPFVDIRAKRDAAGVVIAAMGPDRDGMRLTVEARLVPNLDGLTTIGDPIVIREPDAVGPIDVSVEELASPVPYLVYVAEGITGYDLRQIAEGTGFDEPDGITPRGSRIVHTARGLVSAGVREELDQFYWDPRAVFDGNEPRDVGGGAALAAGFGTVGFDARFAGGELAARALTFLGSGYSASVPATFDRADASSRIALAAFDDVGLLVFDGPGDAGEQRRIYSARLSGSAGSTAATELVDWSAQTGLTFESLHGLEAAARTRGGAAELGVLVHGTLTGELQPGLYLFVARRCG